MLNFLDVLIEKTLDIFFPRSETVKALEKLTDDNNLQTLPKPEKDFSTNTTSLFSYKNRFVRELIWQIKYKANKNLTMAVGKILYEIILEDISDKSLFESNKYILIPIPMSAEHRRERGYNQAENIAEAIIKNDEQKMLTYEPNLLMKIRETKSQTKTGNKKERLENLIGVFSVLIPEKVSGKQIILVDDVITTGSTIAEAQRVLKKAGAANIYTYTVAH